MPSAAQLVFRPSSAERRGRMRALFADGKPWAVAGTAAIHVLAALYLLKHSGVPHAARPEASMVVDVLFEVARPKREVAPTLAPVRRTRVPRTAGAESDAMRVVSTIVATRRSTVPVAPSIPTSGDALDLQLRTVSGAKDATAAPARRPWARPTALVVESTRFASAYAPDGNLVEQLAFHSKAAAIVLGLLGALAEPCTDEDRRQRLARCVPDAAPQEDF
jgi:hypothetical protein